MLVHAFPDLHMVSTGLVSNSTRCAGEKLSSNCPFLTDQMKAARKKMATSRLAPRRMMITLIVIGFKFHEQS
jgi:hypothetical protein